MKRLMLAVLVLLAGCGGPQPVDPQVRTQLLESIDKVKIAALAHDRPAAETALSELHSAITELRTQGKLDPDNASAMLTAADRIAEDVSTFPLPAPELPVVTSTPEPLPLPKPEDPGQGRDNDDRKVEEKGKGNGKHGH